MQTLKTAAIVVLLMTVMYAAYVSMTTPPEPLPAEISSMLVESDEFGDFNIDDGLPDSLGSMSISQGEPAGGDPTAANVGAASLATTTPTDSAVVGSLSDTDSSLSSAAGLSTPKPLSAQPLPAVTAPGRSVAFDPGRSYPSTTGEFSLPDPGQPLATPSPLAQASGSPAADSSADGSIAATSDGVTASLASSTSAATAKPTNDIGFANAIRTADKQFADDKLSEALSTLSLFYDTPDLDDGQRQQLLSRLDPLAATVIYSQRHLLENPHRVRQNETLMEIAARYKVPWQLLANINQISDPVTVLPGTDLKVLRGPFRADVDLGRSELTLFLGDRYAGRFPVAIGTDPLPRPGTYTVQEKQEGKTYYGPQGSVPPGQPNNPFGNMWLDLGSGLSIHGSPSQSEPTSAACISLAGQYAGDLYGILSLGSTVTIRR
ncbi:MAG: L,D-transpeptidase family protein [Planctomycetota bacterium]